MNERIFKICDGADLRGLWSGTFHSIFARILRMEHEVIGYPQDFTIYDSSDSKSLIKAIVKELQLDDKVYKPNIVAGHISEAKNHCCYPLLIVQKVACYAATLRKEWGRYTKFMLSTSKDYLPLGPWILTICC